MTSPPISPSLSSKYWCPCETCKGQGVSSETPIVVYEMTAAIHDLGRRMDLLEAEIKERQRRAMEQDLRLTEQELRMTAYQGIRKPPP
jgi:hypothetical protein